MALFNLNSDLFLGSTELNRLLKFIDESGFRKLLLQNSLGFGIVNNSLGGNFNSLKVEQGTNVGTVKINDGLAIDGDGQLITYFETDNIEISNNNSWYWITIAHQHDHREQGLCSIDANGNLSFPGGELLSILRGLPNNPVKVAFTNATTNIFEYEVVEVIDDENAVLAGDFSAESNLRLSVIGAFTPDVVAPLASKYPFRYDGCDLQITLETILNTPPTLTDDYQFTIARVKRNGSSLTIQDKRVDIFKSKADFNLSELSEANNPLIGIEAVKFDHNNSTKANNLVYLNWGFRSSNWTFDSSINRVTLIGGLGGKYKSTADFVDGDFDGWRLYTKNGKYKIVKQSSVVALQINLILDSLDPDDFVDTTQELRVVPNCEEVEIIAETPVGIVTDLPKQIFSFPVNQGEIKISLLVYSSPSSQYVIKYRYKSFRTYSDIATIPNDIVNGYLVEADFDVDGTAIASARQIYANGIIILVLASSSYVNRIAAVETGDLFGIEYVAVDTVVQPVIDFVVGQRRQRVIVTNDDDLDQSDSDFGTSYVLTDDVFFNLKSTTPSTLRNGNRFLIQLRGSYTPSGFNFIVTQDYVNPSNTGINLYILNQDDLDKAAIDQLVLECLFDGTRWFVKKWKGDFEAPVGLTMVYVSIGDWDMDASLNKFVNLESGVTRQMVRPPMSVLIRGDDDGIFADYKFRDYGTEPEVAFVNTSLHVNVDVTTDRIVINRASASSLFDSAEFDKTSFNRGWLTYYYDPNV